MPKKLLKCGFALLLLGGISGIILCIIALFNPLFFPFLEIFCSIFLLISGFILIVIDSHSDYKRQQKISEDIEFLIIYYRKILSKRIIEQMFINKILSDIQEFNDEKAEDL